jgi:5-methylcytosine-specific restriction endonuclease McrA
VRATRVVHKHKIQFIAGDNFMEKIQAMRALLSHRMPEATFEQVFDAAMEAYLDAHCPVRRKQRREQRQSRRANGMNCRPEDKSLPALGVDKRHTSRHIPTAVRDAVFARDRGRCTFVGDSGRRCTATRYLEMDHIEPFARGGTHDPSNLRLLCRAHNHLAAESIYGRDKMALYSRRERNIAPMRRE